MAQWTRKKILIAVDGSDLALDAVRYVGVTVPSQNTDVVLFHVITRVPESFWDLEKEHTYHYRIADVRTWEIQQEKIIEEFMAQARQVLQDSGFPQEAVMANIQERKAGIARDILVESQNGYSAVVVGRTGLSQLKDIVIGSIANKLVEKLAHVPIWVVGGGVAAHGRILLPVDASEGAMRAVDYVASILDGSHGGCVTLFHAIRGLDIFQQILGGSLLPGQDKEWKEQAEKELESASGEIESTLNEAVRRLEKAGLDPKCVKKKVVTGVSSRAGAIIEEAERGVYDTIIIGRRGLSRVQDFFMGRVSNKVIQLAREKTVWVVG